MGIRQLTDSEKQLTIQNETREMRKAIFRARRDSPVVNRCLIMAEHHGLSSEETMVLLAYFSLCRLEELEESFLHLVMLDIRRPLVAAGGEGNEAL